MDSDLIIVGDEAYTREEWEAEQARIEHRRAYRNHPYVKARRSERFREWAERNRDHLREYNRVWHQRKRAEEKQQQQGGQIVRVVASLHSLACTGPTRKAGCVCKKTLVTRPVE